MRRAVIITAYIEGMIADIYQKLPDDYLICADKGYLLAERENLKYDLAIGDFDSAAEPEKALKLPAEKDETDTFSAVLKAIKLGFKEFLILGGLQGRFDHSYANLQILKFLMERKLSGKIVAKNHEIILADKDIKITRKYQFLSLIAFSKKVRVSASNLKYPLNNKLLKNNFALGVSNEMILDEVFLRISKGTLLIIQSMD